MSQSLSSPLTATSGDIPFTQRRIRHVTAIQVRNLTPFPVRDAFASALSQPAGQSQFTTHGHLSDDLDVTIARKRSRRISANSMINHRSLLSEDNTTEDGDTVGGLAERRTSVTRVNFSPGSSHNKSSGSAPTIKPHRPRTSSINSHLSSSSAPLGSLPISVTPYTTFIPDNSQARLEKVIKSRLVETFLAITIPQSAVHSTAPSTSTPISSHLRASMRSNSPTSPPREKNQASPQRLSDSISKRNSNEISSLSPPSKAAKVSRNLFNSTKPVLSKTNLTHTKAASTSVLRPPGKAPNSSSLISQTSIQPPVMESDLPNYFSPIHRPSTNPTFSIDMRSSYEFTDWTDFSGQMMKVEIWGKVGDEWQKEETSHHNGGRPESNEISNAEWKILDEWQVDLSDLVPLSEDIAHTSPFPSNTLLITLSPPGKIFYLSSPRLSRKESSSPSMGYASDPESNVRNVTQPGDHLSDTSGEPVSQDNNMITLSRRRRGMGTTGVLGPPEEISKTAGWQDLFKLVTLQSCILDNDGSLTEIVRGIDRVLDSDVISLLRREVSEREDRVEELIANRRKIIQQTETLKHEMEVRLECLRQRREMLSLAQEQHQREIESNLKREEEIELDRSRHLSLRARFGPTRTTLLSILSTIYPIELLSPPDLLYTILGIPLPIPLTATDPAPPLTLPSHKDVNDDVVATSLGYAAQVVQLLAAYLGKGLVYPVTCIGSRSLIRDGISAMVGPRMFPLFSKGVDTYRFEYGVFLLNKNIELLMADRDLRALDMRHTLPNLKNLLLTLTDGEGIQLQDTQSPNSFTSTSLDLESPVDPDSTTPKATPVAELPTDEVTSGSMTPTATTTDATRKSRAFLGFPPLTDFIRGQYPSSSRISTKDTSEPSEEEAAEKPLSLAPHDSREQASDDEDEDRRTIHAIVRDEDMSVQLHSDSK